jgi:hypothetical protein
MERSFCSRLYIFGVRSASALKVRLEAIRVPVVLAHRAIVHLGLDQVTYVKEVAPPRDMITLVSGSPSFLAQAAQKLQDHAALFLVCSHRASKRSPPRPAKIRLTHCSFGGPTHFVALFGCHNIPCHLLETALCRTVGHIFDFGVRPEPVEWLSDSTELTIDDILHPSHLLCPILHWTLFYWSGWGSRSLSLDELGITFGFPTWLWSGGLTAEMFPCVPLQIMDACIWEVLDTTGFKSPLVACLFESHSAPHNATWLPGIKRFLPHTWVPDPVITDKAVKHDDAAVHTAMRDNRITLLYPWPRACSL